MKILVIVAHPDDETILTGGALALLAQAGAEVHYLCATRGEGGEVGEPPLCTQAALGSVREKEMRCAVQTLGGISIAFMGYIDPVIGENDALYPYADDLGEVATRVADHIHRICPEVVITHGSSGEYGHPAHVLTHRAALKAVMMGDEHPLFYTFNANFPEHPKPRHINKDDPAHLVLDIESVFQQKVDAAYCHRSQSALFVRRASKRAGRPVSIPEVLVKVEGLHRRYPQVNGKPEDEFTRFLAPWAMQPLEAEQG